ncbi:MAG: hypothetical protein H0W77_12460, partial [Acidobacteria bacterium]|nr:hypothetical protein [Acidobacteriota bacterium]
MPIRSRKTIGLPKFHNLYLGVDGGGTKSQAILLNEEKKAIGEGLSGASNPLR